MKILFIENRYKTKQWEIIGSKLEKDSHRIYFLIQNHSFSPLFGSIHKIPYPRKQIVNKIYTPEIKKVINSCRGLNYFENHSDDYIFWYNERIIEIIDEINPDIVFGESTLFHELLAIDYCRKKNILYLHPAASRYPSGRFSFYKYDTLDPYASSSDDFSYNEAVEIINNIICRKAIPDYMYTNKNSVDFLLKIKDKIKFIYSYYSGEKFNTPSPYVKLKVNNKFKKNIKIWEGVSTANLSIEKFNLLYPLQMQPEANIDVWGSPNSNQVDVIRRIANQLSKDERLYIKPNPKSKYEISSDLIDLVENNKKIVALSHSSTMDELLQYINLIITVTGTISIECIFSNKPVAVFGKGLQFNQKNCIRIKHDSIIKEIISNIKNERFPTLKMNEKVEYLNSIVETSFKGNLGDGFLNRKNIYNKENMNLIFNSFNKILCKFKNENK